MNEFNQYYKAIRFSRWGVENPIGFQVSMPWKGRKLLGDVIDCTYIHSRGCFELTVRHFNGELWPIKPIASAVSVIG